MQARHPGVRLQVTVQKSGDVEAGYARGAFDVGIAMRLPAPAAGRSAGAPAPARGGQVLRREPLHWMGAAQIAAAPPGREEPLRLLALPDTCALHQFTAALLRRRRIPFTVALMASGVAGLQSALAAGLGIACLNAAALCEGVQVLPAAWGLPALPQARFIVLPPRPGESAFVRNAREQLATDFRAGPGARGTLAPRLRWRRAFAAAGGLPQAVVADLLHHLLADRIGAIHRHIGFLGDFRFVAGGLAVGRGHGVSSGCGMAGPSDLTG